MHRIFRRGCLRISVVGACLLSGAPALCVADGVRDRRPEDIREFETIRDDWERVVLGRSRAGRALPGFAPPKPVPPLQGEEKKEAEERLARRCLELAEKHPNTIGELAALFLAAGRGSELDLGRASLERLMARLETADLSQFQQAIRLSRLQFDLRDKPEVVETIARAIVRRVKKNPQDPTGAALLTFISSNLAAGSTATDPSRQLAEAADLLVAHYAASPDINNFCESLGGMHFSPPWASAFELHLRKILEVNPHRWVRCTASLALASVVQLSADRQKEAEELYEAFLVEFDGRHEYEARKVEQIVHQRAKERLLAMRFAPIGKAAPAIEGVDLNGQPLSLSEYRGKVVLLSFWATWCFPCMEFIPHERELAARLAGEPFAIVGVNADYDEQALGRGKEKYGISWRSFRDKRPGQRSISDEWYAVYPTFCLIDHNGIIRKRWSGTPPPETLNRLVDELVEAARSQ